MLYYMAS